MDMLVIVWSLTEGVGQGIEQNAKRDTQQCGILLNQMNIFTEIDALFSRYAKPSNYINREHCAECQEHYQALKGIDRSTLQYSHVENQGWDPTCFLTPEAYRHFLPSLARIAEHHRDWILPFVSRLEGYQCETLSKEEIACLQKLLLRWNNAPDVLGYDKILIERLLQTKFRASEA
jgi:hypothetical protein